MTELHQLFTEHGQSLWLDNLDRRDLRDGPIAPASASSSTTSA
jgi:hypothetical protein